MSDKATKEVMITPDQKEPEALSSSGLESPEKVAIPVQSEEATGYTEQTLPEGCSMMVGDDGEHYVTVVQDGQTYAIPLQEFNTMQQDGEGGILTIQTAPEVIQGQTSVVQQVIVQQTEEPYEEHQEPAQVVVQQHEPEQPQQQAKQQLVMVPVSCPPPMDTLQPVPGPPPVGFAAKPPAAPIKSLLTQGDLQGRNFKPIKVDNWGIFLLSRLQSYFQKKEFCDLTLRFSAQNAQIKVHKLVLNACTDFFMDMDDHMVDGILEMPEDLSAENVAPIIRFMYTGRLDVKSGMFGKLHTTAERLKMTVLTKLMTAQLNSTPNASEPKRNPRRRSLKQEDPIKQMKKIKRIEKKVMIDEKRAKYQAKMLEIQKKERLEYEDALPGKKLPIWKRRSNHVAEETPSPKVTPISQAPPGAKLVPVSNPPPEIAAASLQPDINKTQATPKSYKRTPTFSDKPKIPRQIREIQENLTFEKIRRTGVKKSVNVNSSDDASTAKNKEMSVEELKEFMEEQRKRLQQIGEDEDDYYNDNDAGLDYDEPEDEVDETQSQIDHQIIPEIPEKAPTPAKPILKSETMETPSISRKSVRFSLRSNPQNSPDETEFKSEGKKDEISKPVLKHVLQVDSAVDEFNKAIEEEELESVIRSRSGRIITKRKREEAVSPKRVSSDSSPPNKKSKGESSKTEPVKAQEEPKSLPSQQQVIQEVLKKHPNLFKDNKQVKLKVMIKDSEGNPQLQYLTLKRAASTSEDVRENVSGDHPENVQSYGVREIPKVKYTGRRGRPKKLKPGEIDPHAQERKAIEERLKAPSSDSNLVTLDQVSKRDLETSNSGTKVVFDPSSEAEALSNVASGIATSLGLIYSSDSASQSSPSNAAATTLIVPDDFKALEEFEANNSGTHTLIYETSPPEKPVQLVQTAEDGAAILVTAANAIESQEKSSKASSVNIEDAMAQMHEVSRSKKSDVSKIAMDWNDDEDEENGS